MGRPGKSGMRDLIRQKAKDAEFSGGSGTVKLPRDMEYFKPEKGKNEIIIVPFVITQANLEGIKPGNEYFRLQVLMHFRIGVDEKAVICPRTIGKKCPICEYHKREIDKGADKKSKEMKAIEAKKRDLYNIIDLADDENTVKVWEVSHFNFGELLLEELRECEDDSPVLDFADKEVGSLLTVRMVEESMGKGSKPFLRAKRIDFDERDGPLSKDILEQAVPFDQNLVILTYEQLNALFYDLEDDNPVEGAEDAERDLKRSRRDRDADPDDDKQTRRERERDRGEKRQGRGGDDDPNLDDGKSRHRSRRGEKDDPDSDQDKRGRGRSEREEKDDADLDGNDKRGGRRKSPDSEEADERLPERRDRKRRDAEKDDINLDDDKPARGKSRDKDTDPDSDYDKPAGKEKHKDTDSDNLECPEGGVFGDDCDSEQYYSKCEDCNLWNECRQAADAALAARKNARK